MADMDAFINELQQQVNQDTKELYGTTVYERWVNCPHMGEPPSTNCRGSITGNCGDTITIYLCIEDDTVRQAGFHTTGCGSSLVCGSMAAELALHKHCDDLQAITGEAILDSLGQLPEDDRHCAWLAANALHEAIGEYYKQTLPREKP